MSCRRPVISSNGGRNARYEYTALEPNTNESTPEDDFDKRVLEDSFQRAVQVLVSCLLMSRGADPSVYNTLQETPLHVAVKRKFKGVCKKLLEKGAWPNPKDSEGRLPFSLAEENDDDDIASMLILYMKNHEVRQLFSYHGTVPAEFSFHNLLRSGKMEKTVMAVLNCLVDLEGTDGKATVYFHILESDEKGRHPKTKDFNQKDRSPFQIIAKSGNKTIVNHDIIRLLVRRKWKHYARLRFLVNAILFICNLACLAYAAITAAKADDPLVYDSPRDIVRAVCEVLSVITAIITLFLEIHHIIKHKLEYLTEKFNYLELFSALFLLILVPLRFTNNDNQWQIYSVVFLLWTLRIFKYAAVFRQTGAYAQILVRVIANDFFQFMVVFTVFLLVFSGTLLLALRGENQTAIISDTSSFWAILFLGLRILVESEKVIEYTNIDPWSCFIMVLFLFSCMVLLLNLLIAQLSGTYQHIQQGAPRGLEVNRAWIVARIELRSMLVQQGFRFKYYLEKKELKDINKVLEKWESPPLQEMNKNMQAIEECVETHKLYLQSVTTRLARQERTLIRIQETLDTLSRRMIPDWTINNLNNDACANDDVTI
ncbi:uncharacterized protein LOC110452108 isoform X4 [Mizuhopecten yessoensis]|uniref:uncharacterized protein LOC110452108 isoform X4 n=1 Tax=Mizuhopecten yessoensis TaxID=6573 RepID=UPI000B457262|nr:uncharacterized protein LOC110452108 isoform X4 [Mizuhopecten yessoensis]